MTETKWFYLGDRLRWVERDGQRILQQQMVLTDTNATILEISARKWVDVPLEPETVTMDEIRDQITKQP